MEFGIFSFFVRQAIILILAPFSTKPRMRLKFFLLQDYVRSFCCNRYFCWFLMELADWRFLITKQSKVKIVFLIQFHM